MPYQPNRGPERYRQSTKLIAILFTFILITSCSNKVKEFEGVWITVSQFNEEEEPRPSIAQKIFDFESDSVNIVKLGNYASGNLGEITEEKLLYKSNTDQITIYSEIETLVFDFVHQDSLILKFHIKEQNINRSIVLTRIEKGKELNAPLTGSYNYTWLDNKEIVSFINDSLSIGLNQKKPTKWKIYNYKGINLFVYQQYLHQVATIWNNHSDTINLIYHAKPKLKVTMTRREQQWNRNDLIGSWSKYKLGVDSELPPPPPPELPVVDWKMKINSDTMFFNIANRPSKESWEITDDGNFIYFPNKPIDENYFWEIKSVNNDSIEIQTSKYFTMWYRNKTAGNTK